MIRSLTSEFVESIVTAAGFNIRKTYKVYNDYWPNTENYRDVRERYPWFLVITQYGPILIATRKRVYSISWEATFLRVTLPLNEAHSASTNEEHYSHAWSEGELLDRLIALHSAFYSRLKK